MKSSRSTSFSTLIWAAFSKTSSRTFSVVPVSVCCFIAATESRRGPSSRSADQRCPFGEALPQLGGEAGDLGAHRLGRGGVERPAVAREHPLEPVVGEAGDRAA